MRNTNKYKKLLMMRSRSWILAHQFGLIIFNLFILFLFLLRSAGYFHPFFVITVNFVVISGLISSIFLLESRSKAFFVAALIFWIFAGSLRVIKINIWAERTAIYAYQALIVGAILLTIETARFGRKHK